MVAEDIEALQQAGSATLEIRVEPLAMTSSTLADAIEEVRE